jgi:putative ABC transport system permease protein
MRAAQPLSGQRIYSMNKLIVGNLVHRPLRSLISALAVAIEVIMILSIAAIMYGILNGSRVQQSGIGWDMLAHPGAASALMSTGSASADVRITGVLEKLPHVKVVSPVNIKLTLGGNVENIFGIDYASFNALRPFVFVEGGPFQKPFDIIVDDLQAASKHQKVGDQVKVLDHMFTISGIVEHGKGARKFIPLTTMDMLDGNPGKAAEFFLRTDDAANDADKKAIQDEVKQEVLGTDGLQDWNVQTIDEFLAGLTPEHIPAFNIGLRVVIGIAVIIGFMAIFQSMYTAVMERTREIGILKSMGASRGDIVSVVLRETGLLALVGVALGVGATYLLKYVLHRSQPTMSFAVTPEWVAAGVGIALAGSLVGALYPALKAARKDPIDALSYE